MPTFTCACHELYVFLFFWEDHALITHAHVEKAKRSVEALMNCPVHGIEVFPAAFGAPIRFRIHTIDENTMFGRIAWDGSMHENCNEFDAFANAQWNADWVDGGEVWDPTTWMNTSTLIMNSICDMLEWDGTSAVPFRVSVGGDTSRIPFGALMRESRLYYHKHKGADPSQLMVFAPPKKDISVQKEGSIVLTCPVVVRVIQPE